MPAAIDLLGIAFVVHSIYSAREYYSLANQRLPLDIFAEAIIGLLILVGTRYNKITFKPLRADDEFSEKEQKGQNPFLFLETRPNFQNVLAKRHDYLTGKNNSVQ